MKGIFGKKEEAEEAEDSSSPALVKSLKPTVSIAVLEEKVLICCQFVMHFSFDCPRCQAHSALS